MRSRHALTLLALVICTACGRQEVSQTSPSQHATSNPYPVVEQRTPFPTPLPQSTVDLTSTFAPDQAASPENIAPLLRDVWLPTDDQTPATTYLVYSILKSKGDDQTGTFDVNAFQQVDLRTMQQQTIAEREPAVPATFSMVGNVSPDGNLIAYLRGEESAELRVMQRDGTNDRPVARGFSIGSIECHPRFVWSPDSNYLAFLQDNAQGNGFQNELYTYDVRTDTSPTFVTSLNGGGMVTGWVDTSKVLVLILPDDTQQLRRFEQIAITTGQRTTALPLPTRKVSCVRLAPNNTQMLLTLDDTPHIGDLRTGVLTPLDLSVRHTVWNRSSAALLEFPSESSAPARLFNLDRLNQSVNSTVLQPNTDESSFGWVSVSPDGAYISVCESQKTPSGNSLARTLLYDIAHDRWQVLAEGPFCGLAIGWLSE